MRKVFIFAVLVSMIIAFGATAHAAPILMASGTGSQQIGEAADAVAGILTDGKCVLTVRHAGEDSGIVFTYKLQCFDITGVTQAHIHVGPADGTGPVAVFLFGPVGGTGGIDGLLAEGSFGAGEIGLDLTPEALNDLMHNDGAYLNVHTVANPPGEVRGQLVALDDTNVVEEFFLATASGGQARPAVTTDASCIGSFRVKGENLKYKVKCFNIDGVTQVHIHLGTAQSSGAPIAFLFPIGDPTGGVNGKITRANGDKSSGTLRSGDLLNDLMGAAISDLVERMRTDGVYLNVHTTSNPQGAVRGQITVVETLAGGF